MALSGPPAPPLVPGGPILEGTALLDIVGEIVRELRTNPALQDEVNGKVFGAELPAKFNGQALPEDPRPYIIVRKLGIGRMRRAPVQRARLLVVSVHKTPRQASILYGMVSAVLHNQGPRINDAGFAIYRSQEELGGQPSLDPQTRWPSESATYEVFAATQAVA